MSFVIEKLIAFVAIGDDGDEGVIAFLDGDMWVPLICSYGDVERTTHLQRMAQVLCDQTKQEIKVLTFAGRRLVDTLEPRVEPEPDIVPVCEGCGTPAVWRDTHWETAHEPGCPWMEGRERYVE